ncbi:MAG TPA: SAM-dependent chlorinase/fluorinase [Actinomycetota bacterium]
MPFRFVTFLSDYGLEDEFVGVCRGVIKRIAPDVEVLDLAHGIQPQDVRAGSTVLAQSVPFMPEAVHLAIVDPGVGTSRRAVVIQTESGSPLVGPDNGLLWSASQALGGVTEARQITNEEFFLGQPSRTFQGRDVFAPAAAHIARGVPLEEFGPRMAAEDLVKVELPQARVDDDHVHARVIQFDRFGNLQLNVTRQDLEGIGVLLGDEVELRLVGHSLTVPWGETFSEVPQGRTLVLEDSYRFLTIAINQGSARTMLEAQRGDAVIIARMQKGAR